MAPFCLTWALKIFYTAFLINTHVQIFVKTYFWDGNKSPSYKGIEAPPFEWPALPLEHSHLCGSNLLWSRLCFTLQRSIGLKISPTDQSVFQKLCLNSVFVSIPRSQILKQHRGRMKIKSVGSYVLRATLTDTFPLHSQYVLIHKQQCLTKINEFSKWFTL